MTTVLGLSLGIVFVHSSKALDNHVQCRIVQVVGKFYRLCSMKGILSGRYSSDDLTVSSKDFSIPLNEWRQSPTVSICDVISDPACRERCNCTRSKSPFAVVDLTGDSEEPDDGCVSGGDHVWLKNELYMLNDEERETIESPSGWLNDNIISAAQMLLLQQFPLMSGLQPPTLAQAMAFQVHMGEFVQILCVGGCHWCTISNVGCDDGFVNVYDSMYCSVSSTTINVIIASLLFTSSPKPVIRMMDVGRQTNGSDCGVLSIAFAYDICSGNNPCKAKYNHKSIRQHLLKCLEECQLSRFPLVGERRHSQVKHTQEIKLHCSCHMPEVAGDEMAQCDSCDVWYHQHCVDIPKEVFGDLDIPWVCKRCMQ